jgi:hypothetical protein
MLHDSHVINFPCREDEQALSPAFEFISETVAEGRVTTNSAVVVKLLEWVARKPSQTPQDLDQQEGKFLALLQHLDYQQDSVSAKGQPRILA